MSGKTVDTEALKQAAAALGTYISEVGNSVRKMGDAAQDCSDNMGNDVYSQRAIAKLQSCRAALGKTMSQASELRNKIMAKLREIEES